MADASSAERDPVEKLAEEFLQRRRDGQDPTLSEYALRYPELADEIRAVFPALLLMERADPGTSDLARTPGGANERPDGVPAQLGDFRILREVGRGGMGVVYEAEQVSLGRRVALKVLPLQALANPHYLGRFEREAKAAARLHHTNIVPVYGVGADRGIHYYAMQFIHGQPLNEVLEELKRLRHDHVVTPLPQAVRADLAPVSAAAVAGALLTGTVVPAVPPTVDQPLSSTPSTADRGERSGSTAGGSGTLPGHSGSAYARRAYWQSVAHVGAQAAEALAYAHKEGILHRDIKPSNLLLDARGHVWVTDFGLAKTSDSEDLTHTGDIVGTIRYMAPERFAGQNDGRSDVYALGMTLYELAALVPAFSETDRHKLIKQVTTEEPPHLRRAAPSMPRDLRTIIHKAIDKDPERRYASAAALADDLQRFLEDRPIQAQPPGRVELFARWCRRNPVVVGLLAAVALVAVLGFAGIVVQWRAAVASGTLAQESADIADRRREEIQEVNNALVESQRIAEQRNKDLLESQRIAEQRNQDLHASQEQLQRALYRSDVRLLPAAWEQENLGTMLELLQRQVPQAGEKDLRDFEWHYWNRLCHPDSEVEMQGEKNAKGVTAFGYVYAFSPEGTVFAGTTGKPGIKLWDIKTGKIRSALTRSALTDAVKTPAPVIAATSFSAFSPDGKRLAVCRNGADGKGRAFYYDVLVYDVATGEELWHKRQRNHIGYHERFSAKFPRLMPGSYLAFDADGSRLAACVVQGDKTFIKVWDATTGEAVLELGERDVSLRIFEGTIGFNPDGKRLLALVKERAASGDEFVGRLAVWDATTGHELSGIAPPAEHAQPIAFSFSKADGPLAVVWQPSAPRWSGLTATSAVWLHDAASGEPQSLFAAPAEGGQVSFVKFSPEGKSLLTVSGQGTIKVWDTGTRNLLRRLPNPLGTVLGIGFAGEDRVMTVEASGVLKGWDLPNRPLVVQRSRTLGTVLTFTAPSFLSADGKRLAFASREEVLIPLLKPVETMAASTVGLIAASLGQLPQAASAAPVAQRASEQRDFLIHVVNLDTRRELLTLDCRLAYYRLSANGKRLVVWDWGLTDKAGNTPLIVWDVDTGKRVASMEVFRRPSVSYGLAISADGNRVAAYDSGAGRQHGCLRIWDVPTGAEVLRQDDETTDMIHENFGFSPDGSHIAFAQRAVGRGKPQFHVCDVRSGKDLWTRPWSGQYAFSPDGRRLAISRLTETLVVDAATGEQQLRLDGTEDRTVSVVFSPDGRRLLTVGRAARLWDAATGHELLTLDRAPATESERNRNRAFNVLAGTFHFRADGRRLYQLRPIAPTQRNSYAHELAVHVWDATPLPDFRDLLSGKVAPANNRERLRLITVCEREQRYVAASRLYDDAFAADSKLADAMIAGHRYKAACYGLWAAAGHGIDADQLKADERTRLRKQALEWLRLDLDQWRKGLDGAADYRYLAIGTLRRWQSDPDLVAIRDRDVVAKLPAPERAACAALWNTVDATLRSEAQFQRGVDLENLKQLETALAAYREAIRLNAASGQGYLRLAMALETKKDWDGAVAAYGKLVDLYPQPMNYVRLGLALHAANRLAEADAAGRKAVEVDPKHAAKAYMDVGMTLKARKRLDDAIAAFRKGIEIEPKDTKIHMELGRTLHDRKDSAGAIAAYRSVIAIDPKHAWAHCNIGLVLADQNQLDDAIAEFRKAIDLDGNYADAYGNLGWLLQQQGKWADGISATKKAIALNPRVGWMHNNYGWALEHEGKLKEAAAEYRLALLLPNNGGHAATNLKNLAPHLALIPRLEAIRDGKARPANAAEGVRLAQLAVKMKQPLLAVRLYDAAFAERPELAVALGPASRYSAACHAIVAAMAEGPDAGDLDEKDRTHLRRQALAWLRADLAHWTRQVALDKTSGRLEVDWLLHHWQDDPDLIGIRNAEAVATLPTEEREAYRKLWADVDELLKKPWTAREDHPVGPVYHLGVWDMEQRMNANLTWTHFTPDGKAFLAGGDTGPRGTIRLWEVATGRLLQRFAPGGDPWFNGALFLPDGKQLLTWYGGDSNLFLWDVATGKLVRKVAGPGPNPFSVAVAPDGKRFLAGGNDRVIHVYDRTTGKELARLEGHSDKCHGVFSPDSKQVLTYGLDRTLRLWDAETGKLLRTLEGHTAACTGLFSPDGKQVLSYGPDKTVRLWDTVSGKALRTFAGPTDEVTGAAFLPGEKVVAWDKDRIVRIWAANDGKLVSAFDLRDKTEAVPQMVLTPDGRRLLVTGAKNSVFVLDLATGKEIGRFEGANARHGFSCSPDGRYAASGSFRAGVYLWRLPK